MTAHRFQVGDRVLAKHVGGNVRARAIVAEVQVYKAAEPQIPLGQPLYWIRFVGTGYLGARWPYELQPT